MTHHIQTGITTTNTTATPHGSHVNIRVFTINTESSIKLCSNVQAFTLSSSFFLHQLTRMKFNTEALRQLPSCPFIHLCNEIMLSMMVEQMS